MTDDDLGIVYKDATSQSKKSNVKSMPEDDLGIQFKDEQQAQPEKSGIRDDIGKALDLLVPGASAFAQNPEIIAPGLKTIAKSVPRAAAQDVSQLASVAVPFSPLSNLLGTAAQGVPTPSPETSSLLQFAGNVAPAAKIAEGVPELAKLATVGGKKLLSTLQNKLGLAANQKAKSFMNDLLQGNSVSEATKPVADEIRNKYTAAKSDFNNQYSAIKSEAADRGYAPTVAKQFPGISVATDEKSIIPNNFESALDKIDLSKHSNDINEAIDDFKENPSFEKAHDLQSTLGSEGDKLRSNKDSDNRKLGGQLLNLRSSLKNDISDTLTKNGDTDLLNKYNSIGQNYKKVVAPYLSNTTLRNIVLKKGLSQINPKTIGNLLSKNDTATTAIRNNLSDESKNLLLGTQLKAALKALPKKGILQREADAKSLVNEYGNLDNKGLDFLRTPESIAKIGSIMNDLSRQSKLKWAAGIGIPAVIGAEGARRIF